MRKVKNLSVWALLILSILLILLVLGGYLLMWCLANGGGWMAIE